MLLRHAPVSWTSDFTISLLLTMYSLLFAHWAARKRLAFALCAIVACSAFDLFVASTSHAAAPGRQVPCEIVVVEKDSGWPVPLIELRTIHDVSFVSDNAGVIAFDLPELFDVNTWFDVVSDGYEVPADGFGRRGVRLTPKQGSKLTVEVRRTSIAKRLGRLTGAGIFAESQKVGREKGWRESGILGCDSIQGAVHRGKIYWSWGDTDLPGYPLGIFDSSGATTAIQPLKRFEPPIRLKYEYFANEKGQPRGIAKMPGEGPTWLSGYASLPDASGRRHLVTAYTKIKAPIDGYEAGLCDWNEATQSFKHLRTVWTKSDSAPKHPPMPQGHVVLFEEKGKKWALFGNPIPTLRCPATFEAWQDSSKWESLTPQKKIPTAEPGKTIEASSGSIAWNPYRKRWVTVFLQIFGQPSAFGEVWYAEADSPYGPWGPAVKILSHANYTFYNPRVHPEFTAPDSKILLFEGTYTNTFANDPPPTPRYDYNQILYRLDLDDPRLSPAHSAVK